MLAKIITTLFENDKVNEYIEEHHFLPDRNNQELYLVNLYPNVQYQTIHAFGGAITESVGVTLKRVSPSLAAEVIESYFGASGIGYEIVRTHLDSCDFSTEHYSAVEDETDLECKTFSLSHDEKNIIPYIQAAYIASGKEFQVMLSPWSPPSFMKTNGDRNGGGKLKKEYYSSWAKYICKYIKEYRKLGVNASMISIQNEPNAVQTWDSCTFTAKEEREFLLHYLTPELKNADLCDVEVYIWDHNKERLYERAREEINEKTDKLITGLAFHWYSGDHFDAVKLVREQFPNKKLLFSEGCIEYSRFDTTQQLHNAQMYAHDMIGNLNAGLNTFIDWNIALDENGGPNHANNFCEAPIICNTLKGTLIKKLSYFYISHFSKFIKPNAKRIAITVYSELVEVSAFSNPDGTIAVVLLNRTNQELPVVLRLEENLLEISLKKESICTAVISK